MPKQIVILIIIILLLFLTHSPTVCADENILDTFFRPFENLDIEKTYDQYSVFIDLIIYLLIFVGLSQAVLSKKFQGRGGKAVVISVGLILTIAMIIAEKNLGFNIKTFGPVAAWILIFLISTILFKSIKHVRAGNIASGSIAFVITYFIMRGLIPEFFDLMLKNKY